MNTNDKIRFWTREVDEEKLESIPTVCWNCRDEFPSGVADEFWRLTSDQTVTPGAALDHLGIRKVCCRLKFISPQLIPRAYAYDETTDLGYEDVWSTRPHRFYTGDQDVFTNPRAGQLPTIDLSAESMAFPPPSPEPSPILRTRVRKTASRRRR